MNSTEHLDAFLHAMHSRDGNGTLSHMADDVVLNSPIASTPFQGKQQVAEVLNGLLANVEAFDMKKIIGSGSDYVAVFTITMGSTRVDGMDNMHLDDDGLVDSMTIAWRPLPSLVEVQKKLAVALGMEAFELVPLK